MKKWIVFFGLFLSFPLSCRAYCNYESVYDALQYGKLHAKADKAVLDNLSAEGTQVVDMINTFSTKVEHYLTRYNINYAKYTCVDRPGWESLAKFILSEIGTAIKALNHPNLDATEREVIIRQILNMENHELGFMLNEFLVDYEESRLSVRLEDTTRAIDGWKDFLTDFNKAVYGVEVYPVPGNGLGSDILAEIPDDALPF